MKGAGNKSEFSGEIKVASRIIDHLSSGLYPSPAACLKELVNNAYDADAREVHIFVKPDADRIIIEDDGIGISRDEFERHFKLISESHKRDSGDKTKSGRKKIGKIGIGFIAANELCEVMEIYSTKKGSKELLHVLVDFAEMRKPLEERRKGKDGNEIIKADYSGEVLTAEKDEHYTQIFLTSVRGEAKGILAGAAPQRENADAISLYGLKPDSIRNILAKPVRTWKDFDEYSETMLHIALNVPVQYYEDFLNSKESRKVAPFVEETRNLDFKVFYDGVELRKPIVFDPGESKHFVSTFNFKGKEVSAKGYFYAQHGQIRPIELHGLLVRIRHSAVGEYDPQFWGFSQSEASLLQRWISAEIWADDALEDAMNIDRSTLRVAHPAYVELRKALHAHLRKVLKLVRTEIYQKGREIRSAEKAAAAVEEIKSIAKSVIEPVAPSASKKLVKYWESRSDSIKALQKKYTVADFYKIIVEECSDFLDEKQMEKILKRVSKRLSG